jgi:hypothetical protein
LGRLDRSLAQYAVTSASEYVAIDGADVTPERSNAASGPGRMRTQRPRCRRERRDNHHSGRIVDAAVDTVPCRPVLIAKGPVLVEVRDVGRTTISTLIGTSLQSELHSQRLEADLPRRLPEGRFYLLQLAEGLLET